MKRWALLVSLFMIVSAASAAAWGPNDPEDQKADPDGDNLGNLQEFLAGTNPMNPDTDGGGCPDGWEVKYGLDPTNPDDDGFDMDGDFWTNLREWREGTNPLKANTDDDMFPIDSTDPNPLIPDGYDDRKDDSDVGPDTPDDPLPDYDQDLIPDIYEPFYATNPRDPDCDRDGLIDGLEVKARTDPHDPDTDDDGLMDGQEVCKGKWDRHFTGTDPFKADTDGDGIGDYLDDEDGDGLPNFAEFRYSLGGVYIPWTLPRDADTDGDSVKDGDEVKGNPGNAWQTSDPLKPDTDGDGLTDDIDPHTWRVDRLPQSRIGFNDTRHLPLVPVFVTKGVPFNVEGRVEYNSTPLDAYGGGKWAPIETTMVVQVWVEQGDQFVPISDPVVTGHRGKFKISCTLGDDIRAGQATLKITASIFEDVDYLPSEWSDDQGYMAEPH